MTPEHNIPGKDAIHQINYQAVDPTMTPSQQEAFRLQLLVHHVEFEGLKLIAGTSVRVLKELVNVVASSRGNESFVGYARWRLSKPDRLPLLFP